MYPWLLYKINRYLALIICSIFLLNGPAFTACLMPNISERLINFCLLERTKDSIVPLTFAKEFDYRLKRSGYSNGVGLSGKVEQSVINYNFSPIFYYSSNINGGNPDKDLVLGDYIFKGDRNLLRKKGFLTGVSSGLNGRSIYGEGRHFDFYAQVSHAHSFQYNMGINNLSSGFCFANHIKAFWHIDICGNSSQIRRKIVSERNSDLSLNLAKLSTSNSSTHSLNSLGIRRNFVENFKQDQLIFSSERLNSWGLLTKISGLIGEAVIDKQVTRQALAIELRRQIFGKQLTSSWSFEKRSGGKLFGFSLQEIIQSVNVSYPILSNTSVGLGFTQINSKLDYFSSLEPHFSIQFKL
jgi:hypothetical protein